MMAHKSIFRVTPYYYQHILRTGMHYPNFKIRTNGCALYDTLAAAEEYVRQNAESNKSYWYDPKYVNVYAYVITEMPFAVPLNAYNNFCLSERIYTCDGLLWSVRAYDYGPNDKDFPNLFRGRRADEIYFKPGDLIEVFGYQGNPYWNIEVNLAVVVTAPPTTEEVGSLYQGIGEGQSYLLDVYKVLSPWSDSIDYVPTIAALNPSLSISNIRRQKMKSLYQNYLKRKGDG